MYMDDYQLNDGTEYIGKNGQTPFETFLKYTNQKANSARKLADIINQEPPEMISLLDIGSGNGEFLEQIISSVGPVKQFNMTLIEPSQDLFNTLQARFKDRSTEVINTTFDAFKITQKYDVIIAAHLFYHFPGDEWASLLQRMIDLLNPKGKLLIVLRDKDDVYEFKMKFKPLLFNEAFQASTIDDLLADLPSNIDVIKEAVSSQLTIPENNEADFESIVEFYLNKNWKDIQPNIQQEIRQYASDKHFQLKLTDGIGVVSSI